MDEILDVRIIWQGVPVLLTKQLAEFYGCSTNRIKHNFGDNKAHFAEGKHYFKIEGEDLKVFKSDFTNLVGKNASSLYLWTRRGALRHAKVLNNECAWDVFEMLEEHYFFGNFFERFHELLQKVHNPILCCVYVLEMENGTVKIGYTCDFFQRAAAIVSASGLNVVNWCHSEYVLAEDARHIESLCHQTFSEYRTNGEFFKIPFDNARATLQNHLDVEAEMFLPNSQCSLSPIEKRIDSLMELIKATPDELQKIELIQQAAFVLNQN